MPKTSLYRATNSIAQHKPISVGSIPSRVRKKLKKPTNKVKNTAKRVGRKLKRLRF